MSTQNYKPVPRLKDSRLLGAWSDFKADRLSLVLRVARECGPMGQFRLGPVSLMLVNSPEVLKQLLVDQSDQTTTRPFMQHFVGLLGETALPTINGDYHRRMRRIMAPGFAHKRLVQYTRDMVSLADEAARDVQDGAEVEVVQWMQRTTLRMMAKTIFSMDDQAESRFFQSIGIASEHISTRVAAPLSLPLFVPTQKNKVIKEAIAYLRDRAMFLLREGQKRSEDKGDVMSMLINAKDTDGSGLTVDELRDNILTLYIAGYETTANALSFCFMMLMRQPEFQARIHAELDEVLGGRLPTYEDTPRLRYTLQFIKEVMRQYPPAVFFGRAPLQDIVADGYLIPKGTYCLISPFVLHRNPQYYPDPDRFDPDRFSPEREKALTRNIYMPFGDGPHVCIGQHFAMLEMHLTLALMLQKFIVQPPAQPEKIDLMPRAALGPSDFKVKLVRREGAMAKAS